MIEVLPILWNQGATGLEPREPALVAAALAFMEAEFGPGERDLRRYLKVWALADRTPDGVVKAVMGVIAIMYAVDCPVFHVKAPDPDDMYAVRDFARGYRALFRRAKEFLNDQGTMGTGVFVHVSAESGNATMLKHALRELDAVEAHRVIAQV